MASYFQKYGPIRRTNYSTVERFPQTWLFLGAGTTIYEIQTHPYAAYLLVVSYLQTRKLRRRNKRGMKERIDEMKERKGGRKNEVKRKTK